jgi:hypothetical protein
LASPALRLHVQLVVQTKRPIVVTRHLAESAARLNGQLAKPLIQWQNVSKTRCINH